jgi:bifunctional NMN adenylyltransferase/nudix hydrolase
METLFGPGQGPNRKSLPFYGPGDDDYGRIRKLWSDKDVQPQFEKETEKKEYDKIIFIGRFEPIHLGHIHVLKEASRLANEVIILCGSRNRARSIKNPWRMEDREVMITLAIEECIPELVGRFKIKGIADYAYNDQHWAKEVGLQIARITYNGYSNSGAFYKSPKIAVIGHRKDASSFYLDMFPQWDFVEVSSKGDLNANDIRNVYFKDDCRLVPFIEIAKEFLPNSVLNYLLDWSKSENYERLHKEYLFVQKYRKSWEVAPYAPTFVTTDAVMIESGHVLMIQRGGQPGNGQWALPGGFLDAAKGETIRAAGRRELVEETKIDVPPAMLLDLFKKAKTGVFDHPDRDLRGRIITHAFLIELPSRASGLSKVKGSDDAAFAKWIPLYEIESMSENGEIFSDHADIIFNLTGKI